jgi:hypothetical protein
MNKYILTEEQVQNLIARKIINPFVPKGEDGVTPIYVLNKSDLPLVGEGGLNSGRPLPVNVYGSKDDPTEIRKQRRKEQLKNAQRTYRDKNRDKYNENQKRYYDEMKDDPERYKRWKDNMIKANETYRLKKKRENPQELIKRVEKELKKEMKMKNKGKRGRPSKKDAEKKKEVDALWFETEKQRRIKEALANNENVVIPKQPIVGKFDTEGRQVYKKFPFALQNQLEYPYAGDVGKGDKLPITAEDYLAYKVEGEPPKALKKKFRKMKKQTEEGVENVVLSIIEEDEDEEVFKPKKVKKEKVIKEKKEKEYTPEFKKWLVDTYGGFVYDFKAPFDEQGRRPKRQRTFEEVVELNKQTGLKPFITNYQNKFKEEAMR